MGKEAMPSTIVPSNLRNESYYMATDHETWNGSMLQKHMLPDLTGQNLHQRIGSEVIDFYLDILRHFETFWDTLGHFGTLWDTLGHFSNAVKTHVARSERTKLA